MKYINFKKNKSGFTLIEVLIGCAIMTTMIFVVMSAAQKGISLSGNALKQTQANLLLEEGAEAVRSIRDTNWTTISGITRNSNYYLVYTSGGGADGWSLNQTPTTIDSTFIRTIVVSAVARDTNDDIVANYSSGAYDDGKTLKATVTVSWSSSQNNFSKDISFYLSDIFN